MTQQQLAADGRRAASPTDDIVAYYDETWLDYRMLWLNGQNLSVHFGYFDEQTRSHAAALANMNRVLADCAGVAAGQRVLDAGCGVGGSSMWLAKQRGALVTGITPVASQVARARHYAAQRGLAGQVRFEQADYTAAPFADASFDVVWALESLCHAREKAAFYREAARLLRPGGRLIIAEYLRADRPLGGAGERTLHQWLAGWAIDDIDTRDEHARHAAAAGLAGVRIDDVTAHTRPSLRRLFRMTAFSYPVALALRGLRLRTRMQHGNVVGALRQYQALERGLWFYAIISASKPAA
ncbi:methyltransferase domain-containing protein [Kouleothrix sp.]|uniref:methyltransferase domain-containing protein n=1 Tax=Kouleothrix sp. TaxID=2779161 RepID=UPI00391A9BF4